MVSGDEIRNHHQQANKAAALSVACVVLFAVAFVGVVTMLNGYADHLRAERNPGIRIADAAPEDPFYLLLIGSDSRKGTAIYTSKQGEPQDVQNADIITLVRIDPQDYKVTLLSVPRDTVLDGQSDRLSAALNNDDPMQVVEGVQRLTGAKIDAYIMTTFVSFENLVNALGGIYVDVPKTVKVIDPATGKKVTVKAGKKQLLDGSQALALARARDEYDANDEALRQVCVRRIERAMIQKVLARDSDLNVENVLAALDANTQTNVDLGAIGLLMLRFIGNAGDVDILDGTGTYDGGKRESDKAWVIPEDEQAWEKLMQTVNAGEDPSQVITPPTFSKKDS